MKSAMEAQQPDIESGLSPTTTSSARRTSKFMTSTKEVDGMNAKHDESDLRAQPNESFRAKKEKAVVDCSCKEPEPGDDPARTTEVPPSAVDNVSSAAENQIMPGPQSTSRPPSFPGAFAMAPGGASNENLVIQTDDAPVPSSTDGLVVANLVDECPMGLPIASPQVPDSDQDACGQHEAISKSEKVKRTVHIMIAAILIITIFVVLWVVLAAQKASNSEASAFSSSPSQTPALSSEGYLMAMLPEQTAFAISQLGDSPQSKAFHWLLEDYYGEQGVANQTEEQIRQRFALATLYFATEGDVWVSNSNWLNHTVNECSWFNQPEFAMKEMISIIYPTYLDYFFPPDQPLPSTCNSNGQYQHLWLDQNNLKGTLPDEIFMLTHLETVSLNLNHLEGSLSTSLGMLTSLQGFMCMSTWQPSGGTIPSEIGLLTHLRALNFHDNKMHGNVPSELWQLTNLQYLVLGENPDLQGIIPSEFGTMSKLRWLTLINMDLTGTFPSEIGLLQKLDWITIFQNRLTGTIPSEVGLLTELVVLSVDDNAFEGTLPPEIGTLPLLQWAWFFNNKFTGQIPSEFGLLPKLDMILSLRNNYFTGTIPTELGNLTALQVLELHDNHLSGQIPSELGQLTSLGRLILANNSLTGDIPDELSLLRHVIYTLSLEGNPGLNGTIPKYLCSINNTCQKVHYDVCGTPSGVTFDCSDLLCGCSCSCVR